VFEESIIQTYFRDLRTLILHPKTFFRNNPVDEGLTRPLTFALVSHWIGAALRYLVSSAQGESRQMLVDRWMKMFGGQDQIQVLTRSSQWNTIRDQVSSWLWGIGSVITDPFSTLFWVLFSAAIIFVGARVLIGTMPVKTADGVTLQKEISYASAVQIVAYSMSVYVLAAVPFLGGLFFFLYSLYIATVGAREIYKVNTGRALAVALFPQLLVLAVILAVIVLFFAVIAKVMVSGF
jgi:hypothetical protein